MGKIADAILDGVSMGDAKRRQLLNLDKEFEALETEVQVLRTQKRNLEAEVNPLKKAVERLEQRLKEQTAQNDIHKNAPSYKMLYGCMQFEGDTKLYCPGCYHNRGMKVPTSRKSTYFRYCVACKTDIPAG